MFLYLQYRKRKKKKKNQEMLSLLLNRCHSNCLLNVFRSKIIIFSLPHGKLFSLSYSQEHVLSLLDYFTHYYCLFSLYFLSQTKQRSLPKVVSTKVIMHG